MSLFFRATSGLIQPTGGGPPPTDLELEPVNGSALQVTNTVGTTPRQAWIGFGFGLGIPEVDTRTQMNANTAQLFDELGTTVMRFNSPHNASQSTIGKGMVQIGVANGVDTVIATGYLWRVQNDQPADNYTATMMANEIHSLLTSSGGGMLITHCDLNNEPDGNANNAPTPGNSASVFPVQNATYTELRNRLNFHGGTTAAVKIIGCEWAHNSGFGQSSEQEYDTANGAGLIPGTLAFGAGHNYHDCCTNTQYDDRWMTKTSGGLPSSGIFSTETGYMDLPHWGARGIASMNHGSVTEVAHIGQSNTNDPLDDQTLVMANGTRRTAHSQARVIWGRQPNGDITIPRGSRFRLVTCNDLPAGLNTTFANRMIRGNGDYYPRINSACCLRPDGRWSFVCCNTTHGANIELANNRTDNPPPALAQGAGLGGHYAAVTIQVTATIPDLVAADDRTWSARKCTMGGVITSHTVNQHDGQIRFTLAAGETIGMISDPVGAAAQTWSDGTNWSDNSGWVD